MEELVHSETKEETLKAKPSKKKDDGGTPGPPGTLSEDRSGGASIKREYREQLECNHPENQGMGKEGEADHRWSQAQTLSSIIVLPLTHTSRTYRFDWHLIYTLKQGLV
jgi:hypothetical protein